jgi:hypothetical protein
VSIGQNLLGEINALSGVVLAPQEPLAFPDVAIHETGHLGPFVLADEYGTRPAPIPTPAQAVINATPNLTTAFPPVKWAHLTSATSAQATNCSSTGPPDAWAVLGGGLYAADVYHARCDCRMNQYDSRSFCVVCRQQVLTQLAVSAPSTFGLRVTIDSARILTGVTGDFFIDYKFVVGGVPYSGRWPSPIQPFTMHVGVTEEPGSVFFEIPSSATLGPTLSVNIALVKSLSPLSTGPAVLYKPVTLTLPASGTATITKFEPAGGRGTRGYRLTLGVVRR